MATNPAKMVKNNLPKLMLAFATITKHELLVGVPADSTARDAGSMNNATLAYIHDNGAPEANIPARPFMRPGIKKVERDITLQFKTAASKAMQGEDVVLRYMHRAGLIAQNSIRNTINEGIPPPLAESTLRGRARRNMKGSKAELASRAAGNAPSIDTTTPLVVTGGLRNSITYVVREKK